jgi:hypothetical protein
MAFVLPGHWQPAYQRRLDDLDPKPRVICSQLAYQPRSRYRRSKQTRMGNLRPYRQPRSAQK